MIFNNEAEIQVCFAGRLDEADRWAFWKNGIKWCGTPTPDNRNEIRSLQDVREELIRQCKKDVEYFQVVGIDQRA